MQSERFKGIQTIVESEPLVTVPRKQIGILGGTFNPVHIAHLIAADQVGNALGLEKVLLMPSNQPPHIDEKKTIAPEHRLRMLELAMADNPLLGIEPIELERGGKSYTFDTMKLLKEKHPDTDYFFIIGGDMVEYLPKWHRIDELMQLVNFVGVKRTNYATETPYPIIWIDVPLIEIGSTDLRKKIAQGCSVHYFLPQSVLNYIQEKRLYLDEI